MNDIIRNAIDTYSRTLANLGSIDQNEESRILIMSFLKSFIDKGFVSLDNVKQINESINCLLRNSCVFNNRFICVTIIRGNHGFTYTFPFDFVGDINLCEGEEERFTYAFEFRPK